MTLSDILGAELRRALCGAVGLVLGVADLRPHTSVSTRRDGPRALLRGRTLDGYFVDSGRTLQALDLGLPMPRPEDTRGGWLPDSRADPSEDSEEDAEAVDTTTDAGTTAEAELREFVEAYVPALDTCRRAAKTVAYQIGERVVTATWNVAATWESQFWDANDPARLALIQPSIELTAWSGHTLVMTIAYTLSPDIRAAVARRAKVSSTRRGLTPRRITRVRTRATRTERHFGPRDAPEYEPLRRAFDALPDALDIVF